ncbi:hypothetical protein HN51_052005 [Arachis hypogaea]|uniref:Transmembrane protein n=1 Tax=Arachis hypogaea TaxID=3818 RepID=A0A445CCU3_ARAHY|nr:uncharacterized protein LOC112763634 [Arachis hypogaea]QHN93257.1 uncharacterized protein DS421_17g591130 [Arachis hypogaea]RYR48641.1 hypothetical protein Ahy_A07g034692 [Arachis hypogaea]
MVWPLKERRGPAWKQGWTMNTLSSISAPPFQLVAIVAIVMFLLLLPSYIKLRTTMQTATINLNFLLLFLPLLLILVAHSISKHGSRLVLPAPVSSLARAMGRTSSAGTGGGSPWGVAALVVLLLVLAFFRSNFRSMWSPLVWRSY